MVFPIHSNPVIPMLMVYRTISILTPTTMVSMTVLKRRLPIQTPMVMGYEICMTPIPPVVLIQISMASTTSLVPPTHLIPMVMVYRTRWMLILTPMVFQTLSKTISIQTMTPRLTTSIPIQTTTA